MTSPSLQGNEPNMQRLFQQSFKFSFFEALRTIERNSPHLPRIGLSASPSQDAFRIQQPADLAFAPNTIDSANLTDEGKISVQQRFFGMLGPSGPLPLHMTEIVRNRARHADDEALQAFFDIFHHRMASLFYRAWSSAKPSVQRDRPTQDRFAAYVGALIGMGMRHSQGRDDWNDASKIYFAGQMGSVRRHAEGITAIVSSIVAVPVSVKPFSLRWLALSRHDATQLSSKNRTTTKHSANNCLGRSAVLGERVADRQSMFEIRIGPMSYKEFERLLPGASSRQELLSAVRNYVGVGMDARICPVIHKEHVPKAQLGVQGQLGRDTWIQSKAIEQDREDFCFDTCSIASSMITRSESRTA